MTNNKTLVWFRQDLRTKDNPALDYACELGDIIPVYILDTDCDEQFAMGGASRWWLHHSLVALNKALSGNLLIRQGNPAEILTALVTETGCNAVVWNRCYEPWQIARDKSLKAALSALTQVKSFNASLLWEPMKVLKKDGTPYRVFTPYYRKGCLVAESPRYPLPQATPRFAQHSLALGEVEDLALMPNIAWYTTMETEWEPGEDGAWSHLKTYLNDAALQYKSARDVPSVSGTSRLSPHLHFGEISPHQVWYAVQEKFGGMDNEHIDCFLSELGWREFSYYLLYHFPTLPVENFNDKFNRFPWRQDEAALSRWQQGQTGVPIVDAGMRQLWQTGYMHNRVRMIVGSFLVKNLLLDWRLGERWFWDTLLDADLAANSASWQWVAGSGADAAPYFRVFNPVLQGEKFDKQGEYVSQYCPELRKLPPKYIHQPWQAPSHILQACGITLGVDYPAPIVDLKASRQRALDAFATTKEQP